MESNAKSFSAFSSTGTNLASPHRHQLAIQCPNTYKHTFIQHTKLYRLMENVQLIFYFHPFSPQQITLFFPCSVFSTVIFHLRFFLLRSPQVKIITTIKRHYDRFLTREAFYRSSFFMPKFKLFNTMIKKKESTADVTRRCLNSVHIKTTVQWLTHTVPCKYYMDSENTIVSHFTTAYLLFPSNIKRVKHIIYIITLSHLIFILFDAHRMDFHSKIFNILYFHHRSIVTR